MCLYASGEASGLSIRRGGFDSHQARHLLKQKMNKQICFCENRFGCYLTTLAGNENYPRFKVAPGIMFQQMEHNLFLILRSLCLYGD